MAIKITVIIITDKISTINHDKLQLNEETLDHVIFVSAVGE